MAQRKFHFITSVLFAFLGLGVFLMPREWLPSTITHASFYAFLLFLSAALVYLPPLVIRNRRTPQKERLVGNMQTALAFSLLLNNAGEFGLYGLYQHGFEYDKFCHFLVPMIFAFILAESLRAWEHFSRWKIVWLTLGIVFIGGIVWEIFEFGSDFLLQTKIWGVYGQSVFTDTLQDILFDSLGAIAGVLVFLIPSKHQVNITVKGRTLHKLSSTGR